MSEPSPPPPDTAPLAPGFRDVPDPDEPPRKRWRTVLAGLVLAVLVLVIISGYINLNYYAITPGRAQSVAPLVSVPRGRAHRASGTILLTDVYLGQITLLELVPDWLSSDTQIVPAGEVLDPGTSPSQLNAQGFLEMQQSQDAARAAALSRLGYRVTQRNGGALIDSVLSGSPASRVLSVGDVVTAVDGVRTPDVCAMVEALHPLVPGDVVHLTVQPVTFNSDGAAVYGKTAAESVTMAPAPKGAPGSPCPGATSPPRTRMGVAANTDVVFGFPFRVGLDAEGIGGPSAGLAMTLGIINTLSGGHLAHGVVAATGTIDPTGLVGAVGGVPQKTVAVERAGATVFLVPSGTDPDNFAQAKSMATPSLHVCEVSTLGQALGVLAHYGGHVPVSLHPTPFRPRSCT